MQVRQAWTLTRALSPQSWPLTAPSHQAWILTAPPHPSPHAGSVRISNCRFARNIANFGGAIVVFQHLGPGVDLHISHTMFDGNIVNDDRVG